MRTCTIRLWTLLALALVLRVHGALMPRGSLAAPTCNICPSSVGDNWPKPVSVPSGIGCRYKNTKTGVVTVCQYDDTGDGAQTNDVTACPSNSILGFYACAPTYPSISASLTSGAGFEFFNGDTYYLSCLYGGSTVCDYENLSTSQPANDSPSCPLALACTNIGTSTTKRSKYKKEDNFTAMQRRKAILSRATRRKEEGRKGRDKEVKLIGRPRRK